MLVFKEKLLLCELIDRYMSCLTLHDVLPCVCFLWYATAIIHKQLAMVNKSLVQCNNINHSNTDCTTLISMHSEMYSSDPSRPLAFVQ